MATQIQMALPVTNPVPTVEIADREDARSFVAILQRNGVAVNLREVS